MHISFKRLIVLAVAGFAINGCNFNYEKTGHSSISDSQKINQIQEGVTTREQVSALLGNAIDRNIRESWKKSVNAEGEEVWDFRYTEGNEVDGFIARKKITQVLITFDQRGVVRKLERTEKTRSTGGLDVFRDDFSIIPYKEELPF